MPAKAAKPHGYLGSVSHVDHALGELLDWLVTTTLPKTVLRSGRARGVRGLTRYGYTVNADGKFNPSGLRDMAGGNYL